MSGKRDSITHTRQIGKTLRGIYRRFPAILIRPVALLLDGTVSSAVSCQRLADETSKALDGTIGSLLHCQAFVWIMFVVNFIAFAAG